MWGKLSASALFQSAGCCIKFLARNTSSPGNVAMEEDRAATNLGQAADAEASAEHEVAPRVPKKRFIGRRAAAENAGTAGEPNVTVENSGAIQGICYQTRASVSPTY